MTEKPDRDLLWLSFPNGEARLCPMDLPGYGPGLLLLHEDSPRGAAVMNRAESIGFRSARMKSGGVAGVFLKGPDGYPFRIRELAHKLGAEAVHVKESFLLAQKFPRQAPSAEAEKAAEKPEVEAAAPKKAKTMIERIVAADVAVSDEIAEILKDLDLEPDVPFAEEPEDAPALI